MHHTHSHHHHHLYSKCKSYMNKYVLAETHDGQKFDGIIVDVDVNYVTLAVPMTGSSTDSQQPMMEERIFGWGYPYGYFPPYGYGYYPGRFRRLVLPLTALAALSLLPWF